MKLKTRIIVGFVAVILVPLILFSASLYGFSQTQARHMQESSSQTSDSDLSGSVIQQSGTADGQGYDSDGNDHSCFYSIVCRVMDLQKYCSTIGEAS